MLWWGGSQEISPKNVVTAQLQYSSTYRHTYKNVVTIHRMKNRCLPLVSIWNNSYTRQTHKWPTKHGRLTVNDLYLGASELNM